MLNMLIGVKHLDQGAHPVLCEHRAGCSWGKGPNAGEPVRGRLVSMYHPMEAGTQVRQLSVIGSQLVRGQSRNPRPT